MRSTCGNSSAKPVTVVDEHVISDLFIQMFGAFLHCVAPFLKLQPVWTPLIKKSASSSQMPDNHKPHDENS